MPAHAVAFDAPEKSCASATGRAARRCRPRSSRSQLRDAERCLAALAGRGLRRRPRRRSRSSSSRPRSSAAPAAAARQADAPLPLEFGLQISRFGWEGGTARARSPRSRARPRTPASRRLWLMDHFLQIPQVGREWEDMLESYTTLGYLAGVTSRIRLGTLVTGVTYRNLAHLAKVVATLDVLSGGRAHVRPRRRLVRARAHALRLGVPAAARALRAARGRARAPAADVGPGRAALRGPHDRPWPRRRATRGRCRSASRSSSAARASGGRCGSSRGTPTPATCSATRRRCATSSACCGHCCETEGRDPAAIAVTHLAPARVVAAGEPREGQGAASVRGARRALPRARRGGRADRDRRAVRRAAERSRSRALPT